MSPPRVTGTFLKKEIGSPPKDKCREGRSNPRGIPYLYLAEDWRSAMAEVRPHKNAFVTIGKFTTTNEIKLVDLYTKRFSLKDYYLKKSKDKKLITNEDEEGLLWWSMDLRFSIPLNPIDIYTEYIPTQYLSELFKNDGYDGILYGSSQSDEKYNIVLFDSKKAINKSRVVKKVAIVEYSTSQDLIFKKI